MIKALDETIKKLILDKGRFQPNDVEVRFDQPTRDWSAGLTKPAINCYLYDIRENRELRNREWIVEREANGQTKKKLSPLRVDLTYLITAWTTEVEDEHAVLWRVLVALSSTPVLPEELLVGDLARQPYPITTQTAQVSEAMRSLSDLWNVMENELKPAINYTTTLSVESDYVFSGPMVFTRRLDFVQRRLDMAPEAIVQIAGVVYGRDGQQPVADAHVLLVESGASVRSDRFGRYTFRHVLPGKYTVRVSAAERTAEHHLVVPDGRPDLNMYDLQV